MKKLLLVTAVFFTLIACKKEKDNFEKYVWTLHYRYCTLDIDDIENIQEKTRTFFRNDSVVSFSELQNKEIAFPIIKLDSAIIIKQQVTLSIYNEEYEFPWNYIVAFPDDKNKRDTLVIDTLLFDFKNILNKPVLILKKTESKYLTVLTCENCESVINTTSNFLKDLTIFKVGGIAIGDTISKERLINIKDCEGYNEKGFLEANLAEDENIKLKLINRNIVYSIEQEMIEDESIENIIEVINSKVGVPIDTLKKYPPFYPEREFQQSEVYRWITGELYIELRKDFKSQYFFDKAKKTKSEFQRYVLLKLSSETFDKWKLKYNNNLLQAVLEYYQDNKKVSTIIE